MEPNEERPDRLLPQPDARALVVELFALDRRAAQLLVRDDELRLALTRKSLFEQVQP